MSLGILCVLLFLVDQTAATVTPATPFPPPLNPLNLREVNAQTMYSFAAYCTPFQEIIEWNCYWCIKNSTVDPLKVVSIAYNSFTDTFGFVGITQPLNPNTPRSIHVVFRGTKRTSVKNWLDDLDAFLVSPKWADRPRVGVHQGFWLAWSLLKTNITAGIKKAMGMVDMNTATVHFTGHSLGGSLATLASIEYYRTFNGTGVPPIKLVTFGCPRVGNLAFARYINSTSIISNRIVNQFDVIPHLPLVLMDYHHITTEYWFPNTTQMTYRQCNPTGEDTLCSDSVSVGLWSVRDHSNYILVNLQEGAPFNCSNGN